MAKYFTLYVVAERVTPVLIQTRDDVEYFDIVQYVADQMGFHGDDDGRFFTSDGTTVSVVDVDEIDSRTYSRYAGYDIMTVYNMT